MGAIDVSSEQCMVSHVEGPKKRNVRHEEAIPKFYAEDECNIAMELKQVIWDEI